MGESGQVILTPGIGDIRSLFVDRAHAFRKSEEVSTPYVYEVTMQSEAVTADHNLTESIYSPVPGGAQPVPDDVREGANGHTRRDDEHINEPSKSDPLFENLTIHTAMTATSHVGHLRFDFMGEGPLAHVKHPHVFIQATRQNWTGHIEIDPSRREVTGSNTQRQDYALGPDRAPGFASYFVARFSEPFVAHGIAYGEFIQDGISSGNGTHLGAYVKFPETSSRVEVRTGVSFISIEQAKLNLELEAPDSKSFDTAVEELKSTWLEKLDRVAIEGVNKTDNNHDPLTIFYTALFHALQYPSDLSEPTGPETGGLRRFYSGYTDSVHSVHDSYYQSWSIWDTYRAEHSLLTLFAPERVNSMMRSLLKIYSWSGWLPMWANIIETNIMIGTHVDAILSNALSRGFNSYNITQAWSGVKKNAFTPPDNDTDLLFFDREGFTPAEARAGLTSYMSPSQNFVSNDQWSESASRTLDYSFDDHAASIVASYANDSAAAAALRERSKNYKNLFNSATGFFEARNANGSFAGAGQGWCEGDAWVYAFAVPHDISGLASLHGGPAALKAKLDTYFSENHNDHTNEPSHHVPYLYSALGFPSSTAETIRAIGWENYNATSAGLSGNEDLGQMSAWYIFSAMGFYPLDSAGEEYIVGTPFFEKIVVRLPAGVRTGGRIEEGEEKAEEHTLTISAPGVSDGKRIYVKHLRVDGESIEKPMLRHSQIVNARRIEFEMSESPTEWGGAGIL
jgi:predicted alpha-1,2-mannosidase